MAPAAHGARDPRPVSDKQWRQDATLKVIKALIAHDYPHSISKKTMSEMNNREFQARRRPAPPLPSALLSPLGARARALAGGSRAHARRARAQNIVCFIMAKLDANFEFRCLDELPLLWQALGYPIPIRKDAMKVDSTA
jgi:hypothetical protein